MTLDEIRQPLTIVRTPPSRGPLVGALVLAAVLILGLGVGLLQGPSPTTTAEIGAPPPASSVALGDGHIWPETPSALSEIDLAVAFARELLGWETAAGQAIQGDGSESGTWVRVQRNVPVEVELLDVFVATLPDGGNVVMRVGTPWARGMDLVEVADGVRAPLLRIAGDLHAEGLLRLADGEYVFETAPVTVGGNPALFFPGIDVGSVSSGLIRYLNQDGTVHAAVGDVFTTVSAADTQTLSCVVTVPSANTPGPIVNGASLAAPDGMAWVGGPGLATFLPIGGAVWENLPVKGELRTQKFFLWAEGYDWVAEPEPDLQIVARPGEPTQPEAVTSVSNGSRGDWGSFMVVGVDLAPGCWTVDLEYEGAQLTFTVEVAE